MSVALDSSVLVAALDVRAFHHDFLHLAAAGNACIPKFFTLNTSHFLAFHRPGDPEIVHP